MFHPTDHPLERGWVGRVQDDRVVHLAAQTLQHFFTGGASAREHAEYPLTGVAFVAPVLQPPSIRVFEDGTTFAFANPAAVLGPGAVVRAPAGELVALARLAAVVVAESTLGGVTCLLELRAPVLAAPKDRDFALVLGPLVVTPDELGPEVTLAIAADGVEQARGRSAPDWGALIAHAAEHTTLRTGDLLAAPAAAAVTGLGQGAVLTAAAGPIGVLTCSVAEP
jgi:hypothetical protein